MPASILEHDPASIRAMQDVALRRMVELCAIGHPFYRQRFNELGLSPASLDSLDALAELPLTTKHDLMSNPEAFRLNIADLPVQERVLWDIAYTTGTTGQPTPIYSTTHDFYATIDFWTRLFTIAGVTEDDILANLYPLTAYPSGAFLRTAVNGIGALVVNCMPGAPYPPFPVQHTVDHAIRQVERKRATVLAGVPSFMRRLLMRAEELGADFSAVRLLLFTGEPCPAGLREDIRARLLRLGARDPKINIRLGFTEAQGALVECREGSSLHNPGPDLLYYEIVDPETHQRLPDGRQGLLVMTHLNRRGTVLLRYAIGDITAVSEEPCPDCGRAGGRVLQQPFRADHLTKIKGMLVNPDVIRDLLTAKPQVEEYQIVFRKVDPADPYSMDELVLKIAAPNADQEALRREIVTEIRDAVRVGPAVEFVSQESIFVPGDTMKARRIIDERPKQH